MSVVSREQSLTSLAIIIGAWPCMGAWNGGPGMGGLEWGAWNGGPGMGGLEWGAWYGGPGIVRNVPNPDLNWGERKKVREGGGEGTEENACPQTPRF